MIRKTELPAWGEVLWQDFRHLALYGGRGGGKTRTIATALVLQASQRHERVLCGREIQRSIRDSVKRVIEDEIARLGLSHLFTATATEIKGPNDSLFLFAGIRGQANAIRSIEGITTFWGEEAQAFSQASIDTVIPTIRAPGSRLIWSWNPIHATDPVDRLFRSDAGSPPRSIVLCVNHCDNPWFPPELRAEMEYDRGRDTDKYLHIWEGHYRLSSEARVFRNWRVEDFESPEHGGPSATGGQAPNSATSGQAFDYRLGADFGFSIDPSVAVRCRIAAESRTIYVDYEAWGLGVEIVNLPALFLSIPDAERYWMTADSSRPETISHLRNHGFPRIAPALKGARSLEEGIAFLQSYEIIVHPRCTHVIDELIHYTYRTDSLTGQVLGVLEDRHNHCIDALRYAVEGARRAMAATGHARNAVNPPPTLATGFNRGARHS